MSNYRKKNAIRSESVLNPNTVKVNTDGSKLDGRVGAGFYAEHPNNSSKQAFFHLGIYQRWSPRGHILKSLAFASRPQVLENWPVLGSRTALFFELLKFCGALEKFFGKHFFMKIA